MKRDVEAHRTRRLNAVKWPASSTVWVGILVITGCFHLYRGAVIDGVIFLGVAAVLLLDAAGVLRFSGTVVRRLSHRRLGGASGLLGVILVSAPLYGAIDVVVVAAIGVVVLVIAWPSAAESHPRWLTSPPHRRSAVLWSCVGVSFCLWELVVYFLGRPSVAAEYAFPPLSDLLDPILQTTAGRIVLIAAWLAGGIALLRRGRPA